MNGPVNTAAAVAAGPTGSHIGAFFDVDGTLVDGFTAVAHAGHRIRRRQARLGEVLGVIEAATRYRLGRMEFERLMVRAAGYLRGEPLAELEMLGADLFTRRIEARMFPEMREIVQAHQRQGHTVAIFTSALNIHIDAVAASLGIEHVLCNYFDVDESGRLTGYIRKPVIWGRRKAEAVSLFSAQHDIELAESFFYADGEEDLHCMRLVGNPRPVNPRRGLAVTAAEKGWPVLRVTTRPPPDPSTGKAVR